MRKTIPKGLRQSGTTWIARTTVPTADGKRRAQRKFSAGTERQNFAAACTWLHKCELIRNGIREDMDITNLGELFKKYFESIEGTVKDETLAGYQRHSKRILEYFGSAHGLYFMQSDILNYTVVRRKQGVGRVIIKELTTLRSALTALGVQYTWRIPRALSSIPKQEMFVPSDEFVAELLSKASPDLKLAIELCLKFGLRDQEFYKLTPGNFNLIAKNLTIPSSIRKTSIGNVVPIDSLSPSLMRKLCNLGRKQVFNKSRSELVNELKKISKECGREISGFQPFRRCLVTWAEDAGFDHDTISLVTGHIRTSQASAYSSTYGRFKLKRDVIDAIDKRLCDAMCDHVARTVDSEYLFSASSE